ncbi:MAG: 2-amino-4-hydroxy-6-hydroxymethyldihydropteridine diphosphokinase [Proteobacteria bacterium]|nr:2-amino-4-hydroxy-6-hydroxymethyldihydropteridine diphosphokinase [Pseudomonadota bacterium]NOG61419.1 2-amino-4-hydroxy-6-hydroxymethyldihydropteridine diphosphokinase [Pseudomonadota bacterium]
MTIVYIGLGSNMDFPEQHIITAIQSLGEIQSTRTISVSSLYKSKPVGPQDQDDYINVVAKLETGLGPLVLLDCLQTIENEHGRIRNERWGPRTLDLDILMFGDEIIQNDRLTIPHPEMLNRSFVLVPLAEIDSEIVIPGKGLVRDLLSHLDQSGLEIM